MYFSLFLFLLFYGCFLWNLYLYAIFLLYGGNKLPELIKRRSNVQEKKISCDCALNLDQ